MASSVEVEVLGPLRLRVDGQAVDVPGERRRALLALLALARGHPVSIGRIVDALWGDDPPAAAMNSAQSHVSRLRRHLGDAAGCLTNDGAGYRLALADDGLDADRAVALAGRARA
ncbi:MAG: winged helix-turn-helix domain-containing protein, partial [Actinomycetota bacterium]|nr:winged helix-turn-helix domain-containing protein [Actinomycetota bacterium]